MKTPFYRVIASFGLEDQKTGQALTLEAEWRAAEGSRYFNTPALYKENGFKEEKTAKELIEFLSQAPMEGENRVP